jgi:hypothetical protein
LLRGHQLFLHPLGLLQQLAHVETFRTTRREHGGNSLETGNVEPRAYGT